MKLLLLGLKSLENEILLPFYSSLVSFRMSERAVLPQRQDPREGMQLVGHVFHGVDLIPIRANGQTLRALMGQVKARFNLWLEFYGGSFCYCSQFS